MVEKIAIFLFMTFCIWGWLLLWPIAKIKTRGKKGWCIFTLVTFIIFSFLFSLSTFLSNQPLTIELIKSNIELTHSTIDYSFVWITFWAGLTFSFLMLFRSINDNKNSTASNVGIAFTMTACVMIIGTLVLEFVYNAIMLPFLIPLFHALF